MTWDPGDFLAAGFNHCAFRLQLHPEYGDWDPEYLRWRRGDRTLNRDRSNGWTQLLRMEMRAGCRCARLKVISHAFTTYEQYLCSWQFEENFKAGEDIRILDSRDIVFDRSELVDDFWILDDSKVICLEYDSRRRFRSSTSKDALADVQDYRRIRDTLWDISEPYGHWRDRILRT